MNRHPYHIVNISPWPLLSSIGLLLLGLIICSALRGNININYIILNIITLIIISYQWFRDIIRETKGGYHTKKVRSGIYISFIVFLITEIMLFFSFFWAFFHSSLVPTIELGCIWPRGALIIKLYAGNLNISR